VLTIPLNQAQRFNDNWKATAKSHPPLPSAFPHVAIVASERRWPQNKERRLVGWFRAMRRRDARETQCFFEVAGLVKECIWTRVYKSGNSTSDARNSSRFWWMMMVMMMMLRGITVSFMMSLLLLLLLLQQRS
jgi:hypothetical protein